MLPQIGKVSQLIEAASAKAERAGRIDPEVSRSLRQAGCYRMAVPSIFGGEDLRLPQLLSTVETLARADGAVGWAVGQVALSQIMLSYLSQAALEQVYADGPDVLCAGAAAPKGHAVHVNDGWRVNGQWPLVSGALDALWIFLQCIVMDGNGIRIDEHGVPSTRMVLFPADALTVLHTWDAVGLCATGSNDVQAVHVVCPDDWSVELATGVPRGAATRVPPPAQGGLFVAAVVLGVALGALDALGELVSTGKRPAFSPHSLREQPLFQDELGDAQLSLSAARSLLYSECEQADARAAGGCTHESLDTARLRAAGVKAIDLAVSAIDSAYRLAGASAVYAHSSLQRCMRDAHTATQHFTANHSSYMPLGALLALGGHQPRRDP